LHVSLSEWRSEAIILPPQPSVCYNNLMVKSKKSFYLLTGSVILIILAVGLIFGAVKNTAERSDANTALFVQAIEKKDESFCDQINGGIMKREPRRYEGPPGVVADDFSAQAMIIGLGAMNEIDAKKKCREWAN
jgi:hypothetical protein